MHGSIPCVHFTCDGYNGTTFFYSLTFLRFVYAQIKNCIPQGRVPSKSKKIKETHNVRQWYNNAFMAITMSDSIGY